jgi:hypothetical protein
MLTLLGTLFGGLFRLAPELLKWLDRRDDRAHELAMFDKQLEADKFKFQAAQQLAQIEGENALNLADVQAMIAATNAQGQKTGIPFVDGLNALVRPILTFWWCIVLYTAALGAEFYTLVWVMHQSTAEAILNIWGQDEKAIVASIISFWFVDRALRKLSGR